MRMFPSMSILTVGALAIFLVVGCQRMEPEVAEVPPVEEEVTDWDELDFAVELTYPQSDDQGNYVAVDEPGEVIVEGIASGPEAPGAIDVNGTTVQPYQVENISPYGMDTGHPTYRFRAPVIIQPDAEIVVTVWDPYEGLTYHFSPDTDATLDRWSALAEDDPALEASLARAHYARGEYDEGITYSQNVAEREESGWVLYDLGRSHLALGRTDEAIEFFDRAEVMDANMPDLYLARGQAYHEMGDHDQAIADFEQASELASQWAEPLLALAMTHYEQNRLDMAANHAQQAMDTWPAWPAPYYALAMALLQQDRTEEAVGLIIEAEQRGPWQAERHVELAQMLHERDDPVAARRQLEIAEELGASRAGWWAQVEQATPGYEPVDTWPWLSQAQDDGYRVAMEHPWYRENRPVREMHGAGFIQAQATPGGMRAPGGAAAPGSPAAPGATVGPGTAPGTGMRMPGGAAAPGSPGAPGATVGPGTVPDTGMRMPGSTAPPGSPAGPRMPGAPGAPASPVQPGQPALPGAQTPGVPVQPVPVDPVPVDPVPTQPGIDPDVPVTPTPQPPQQLHPQDPLLPGPTAPFVGQQWQRPGLPPTGIGPDGTIRMPGTIHIPTGPAPGAAPGTVPGVAPDAAPGTVPGVTPDAPGTTVPQQ